MTKNNNDLAPHLFPKRPHEHIIGEKAVTTFRASLPDSWIVREASSDYGIDCALEFTDENRLVSGAMVLAQVKGTTDLKRKCVSVRMSSARYWSVLPLPVIIVLVTNDVRWLDFHSYLQAYDWSSRLYTSTQKHVSITFRDANILPQTSELLRELAIGHQDVVANMRSRQREDALVFDVICHALVYCFARDVNKMLQWLRESASNEMLCESLPQVMWLKSQIDADAGFLDRITKIVVREGFVDPPGELKEQFK